MKKSIVIIGLILAGCFALYFVRIIILPFILGAVLAFLLLPLVEKLEHLNIRTNIAIIICYVIIILILGAFLYWGIPKLVTEMSKLTIYIPQYLEMIKNGLLQIWQNMQDHFKIVGLDDWVRDGLAVFSKKFSNALINWLSKSITLLPGIFGNVWLIIFAPVLAYYLMKDRTLFSRQINKLFSPEARENLAPLCGNIYLMLRQFIRGYFVVAFLVGFLFMVLLLILRVDYAVTMGIIMAIAELIPYVGLFIAAIPIFILASLQGIPVIIKVVIAWAVVQQAENWFISPKIIGNSVDLHPLAVILTVLLGGYWFGILGMIIAVPVCAMLKIIGIWAYERIIMWKKSGKATKNN